MAWGSGPAKAGLEPGGAGFFGDGAGAKASRLLWRKLSPFTWAMGLPADASGAYRPNPQATTKLAPRPSSRKGYDLFRFQVRHKMGGTAPYGRVDRLIIACDSVPIRTLRNQLNFSSLSQIPMKSQVKVDWPGKK